MLSEASGEDIDVDDLVDDMIDLDEDELDELEIDELAWTVYEIKGKAVVYRVLC